MTHQQAFIQLLLTCMDMDDYLSEDETNAIIQIGRYPIFESYDMHTALNEYFSSKHEYSFVERISNCTNSISNDYNIKLGVLVHCIELMITDHVFDDSEEVICTFIKSQFDIADIDYIYAKKIILCKSLTKVET